MKRKFDIALRYKWSYITHQSDKDKKKERKKWKEDMELQH